MPTPNYGWDHIASNQASKEITANGVFDAIDAQVKANDTAAEHVSRLDTDGTLAANSDAKYPSQKAVKTYADTKVPKTDKNATPGYSELVAVPSTAGSAGVAGQEAYDATHYYRCVATNTWVRVTLATF